MGHRLLIVDSDQAFLKMHRVALDSAFDVDLLSGTEGALQRLESGEHAAVLICVEASENKGYALCSGLRKHPLLQGLKVALISAKATEEEYTRHQSLRGRADVYLHKPILSSALIAALSPLLPPRPVDPDNPLGDLSGVDLGEEWLKGLEAELDVTPLPQPAPDPGPLHELEPIPEDLATLELEDFPQENEMMPPALRTVAIALPSGLPTAPNAGTVELLETRIGDLEAKLVESARALEAQSREAEAHRNRLEELEAHSANLPGMQAELLELRERSEALLAQISEATEAREAAEGRLSEAEQALEASRQGMAELEERVQQAESERDQVRSEAGSGSTLLEETQKELDLARQDVTGLEATLRAQRRELAEQGTHLNGLLKDKESLQELSKEHAATLTRLEEVQQDATHLQERVAELEGAQSELENGRDRLEEALQRSEAEGETQIARIRELEEKVAFTERERDDARHVAEELRGACDAEHQRAQNLEAELRGACEDFEQRTTATAAAHQKEILELLGGLDEREAQLLRLNQTLNAQRERLESLEQDRARLETDFRDASQRLHEREEAALGLEDARLRLESDLRELAQQLTERDESAAVLEQERLRLEDALRELAQRLAERDESAAVLEQERQRLEDELKPLTEQLREREEAFAALEQERRRLEGDLSERTARLEALTQAIGDLEQGIRRATDLTRPF